MPSISVDEINDKSKTDSFARIVSVAQITWIVVQVLARAARRLAISQLEISVAAYSGCAIIIHILHWSKPKGVLVPHTVHTFPGSIPQEITENESDIMSGDSIFRLALGLTAENRISRTHGSPFPNDFVPESYGWGFFFGAPIATSFFGGGVHIAAWNFAFPTWLESILWRVSSIYCTGFFFFFAILGIALYEARRFQAIIYQILISLYVLARAYLIVEMFRTLCFLPPDAYISTWAANIPHLA